MSSDPKGQPETAREIAEAVREGRTTAEAVVRSALERIDAASELNAFVHRRDDVALSAARELDRRRDDGETLGKLAGVPVAVKDNICTGGWPTTCGSKILDGFDAPYDATAVARLVSEGAVLVAKTNCDEFAMGSSNENSAFGAVKNPHDAARAPGGSSGGSAAAVAAGTVPLALGSETGGSVRQPAAFCGVVGVKPTYGRVSRWGLVAFGSSLDQIGPLTRSVDDAALALEVMAGHDERDATSSTIPTTGIGDAATGGGAPKAVFDGLRVGRLHTVDAGDSVAPAVDEAVDLAAEKMKSAGARVKDVKLPLAEFAIPIYYLIASAEASSNLARYDGVRYGLRSDSADSLRAMYDETRGRGFGREVKRRVMLGTFALSSGYYDAYYGKALAARAALTRQIDELFESVDLLLLPTTPQPAFRLGEKLQDPVAMYLSDVFTVPANLGGHCALSVPGPRSAGELPVGVQLMGPRFAESRILSAARALEEDGFAPCLSGV